MSLLIVAGVTNAASTLLSTHEYATLSCSIPAEEDMFKWKVTGLGGGGGGGKGGGACALLNGYEILTSSPFTDAK